MTPAVRLQSIRKRFPGAATPLFEDLSLSVAPGEAVAIVGPSGCGKSTLLNLISLLEEPDGGEVLHDGAAKRARDVGTLPLAYIFQRDALLPWATVAQNLIAAAESRKVDTSAALERARGFLARAGLTGVEGRHPHALSGGQRQLVALAQALMLEPDLLLLDEPFAHLDFQTKLTLEAELLDLVRLAQAQRARPITLVLVTHDIDEAVVVADRVVVLGGYPSAPTRIVREISIEVAAAERDPVKLRESAALPAYFRQIWAAIRTPAPEPARVR